MNRIITISRQFGSGGREIGRRLAEELGYAYYDHQLVVELAQRTDLAEDYLQTVDEMNPVPLMPITIAEVFTQAVDPVVEMNHEIFRTQSDLIRELAAKSNCVFVGRAADYILREQKPLRLFIVADDDYRCQRCHEKAEIKEALNDKQLLKRISAIDKRRARYYEFYTDQTWGDPVNYDLCINTSNWEIKQIVAWLADLVRNTPDTE